MGLNGCCTTVKYLMVIVNTLFLFLGIAVVACSVWMLMVDPTLLFSMKEQNHHFYNALCVFLAIGALMMIVAFIGCCGAFKESQCLLVTFFCLLLIIIVGEVAIGAWVFPNRDKLDEYVKEGVKATVQQEYSKDISKTNAFDTFQRELHCCGAEGPSDWASSIFNNVDKNDVVSVAVSKINPFYTIPESCCQKDIDKSICDGFRKLSIGAPINPAIYHQGCISKFVELVHDNWIVLLSILLAIILLELFGLVFSLALCCTIRSQDHYKA